MQDGPPTSLRIDLIGKLDELNSRRFAPVSPNRKPDRTATDSQRLPRRLPITSHTQPRYNAEHSQGAQFGAGSNEPPELLFFARHQPLPKSKAALPAASPRDSPGAHSPHSLAALHIIPRRIFTSSPGAPPRHSRAGGNLASWPGPGGVCRHRNDSQEQPPASQPPASIHSERR